MTGPNSNFLLGILNSAFSKWFVSAIATTTGMGATQWKKFRVELIPIPLRNKKLKKPLVDRVEKILKAKALDPQANTETLEREIDREVFRLYGLGYEEACVVHPDFGGWCSEAEYG